MNETPTAFVLAQNKDAAQITAALRSSGYRVVDPVELDELAGFDREVDDAPDVVRRDTVAMMDCDMIITGPGCELLPWAVAVVATACTMKKDVLMIERVVPHWRKVAV
jgi:hypothetical protein